MFNINYLIVILFTLFKYSICFTIMNSNPIDIKNNRLRSYSLNKNEIPVRFINSPNNFPSNGKNDIIAIAKKGDILLKVADSVNINLPRGCLSGLCGSCTCDIKDLSAGKENNFKSIACACSTIISSNFTDEFGEIVVDVYRMVDKTTNKEKINPMQRFSKLDDPNKGFKPRWKLLSNNNIKYCNICKMNIDTKLTIPYDCTIALGCPFNKKTKYGDENTFKG